MAKFTRKKKVEAVSANSEAVEAVSATPEAVEAVEAVEVKKDDPSIDTMVTRLKTAFAESRAQHKSTSANFVIQVRLPADCEPMYKSLPTLAKREVKAVFESAIRSAYKLIEESER